MKQRFLVNVDHFQLFIADSALVDDADTGSIWNDKPHEMVVSRGGLVAMAIARFGGAVPVEFLLDEHPDPAHLGWTPIGRFELVVSSGRVALFSPESEPEQVVQIEARRGVYDGTVSGRGMDAVIDDLATTGPDEYRIALILRETR